MKIEFWLDYLSPECYKQHQALELLFKKYTFNDLELLYRSYELIPNIDLENNQTLEDVLMKHHIISYDEAKALVNGYSDYIKPVKVHDVHRISHLAKRSNVSFEFNQAIFKAYYQNFKDISDPKVLIEIGTKVGLKKEQIEHVLASDMFHDAVLLNRENATIKGIFDVPHIRIDGKIRLKGYHSDEQMIEAISLASIKYQETDFCEGEHCDRKKAI
ncbi:MAG: hypothetical protein CVV61_04065 [Tenericutes bacterium HGW-Tenericutes-6]|jgi:predicted DsbA family dithiol-disulfide isomerase|nr:MAG: hypothetical protein CVV62_02645 [Tenericutes bacterium HGW-Tenericutes-7]PKK93547.1 MAG: hypothetical protein CVV61_04065 [Tenericutes bacterium HGW-Tenericutes-6]